MKLRTSLLLGVFGVILGLVAATVVVLTLLLERDARRGLATQLDRAEAVYQDLHDLRSSLHRSETLTMAQEPRLKAAVATTDIDRSTLLDIAQEMQQTARADILLLLDATGHLLADAAEPTQAGHDLRDQDLVRTALTDGEASGVWTRDDRVFQVHARRLDFGEDTVGMLVLGRAYAEQTVATVARQTGSDVALVLDGKVVAAALADPSQSAAIASFFGQPNTDTHTDVLIADERRLVRTIAVPGYTGQRELRCVILESLDSALATSRALTQILYGLAALALLLASLVAWVSARRLSRPVDRLVEFTRALADGQLQTRAPVVGPVEIRSLAAAMNHMASELDNSRRALASKERLERELEIATRIQTSLLPQNPTVPGLEIDARMQPASEVGGDYYDVLPVADGCWLGIGDVAGHGLTAGLVMLMLQSVIGALVQEHPNAHPAQLLPALNAVLYKNIRERLDQDEHITLTLLCVRPDGDVLFAGAHEEILVCRAAGGPCERFETPGTWLGVLPLVDDAVPAMNLRLQPGDVMLLYSDGLIEAMDTNRRQFGMDRVCAAIEAHRDRSVKVLCDRLMAEVTAWMARQDDDITILAVRYHGPAAPR